MRWEEPEKISIHLPHSASYFSFYHLLGRLSLRTFSKLLSSLNQLVGTQRFCTQNYDLKDYSCPHFMVLYTGEIGKFGLGMWNEAGQRPVEFCQENSLVIANTLFQEHKRRCYTWTSPDGQHQNRLIIFFAAKDGEALYSQQK